MNSIQPSLIPSEIRELFVNYDPAESWKKATLIVHSISPNIDLTHVRNVFDDVMCLFNGSYLGYSPIQTPYHDLRHTLDVFMCAVRLMHGIHLSDTPLNDEEIKLIMVAALLHDVGYAQKFNEANGSGAQFTQIHVSRGIDFMAMNLGSWLIPANWEPPLRQIIRCTDLRVNLSDIKFGSPRIRLLGQIVGSADVVGQMADRTYLEKLLFLYSEFKEADYGNCENTHDLLKKSRAFYDSIRKALDSELGSKYQRLNEHFKHWIGEDRNFYIESIENNIQYLEKVISLNESDWFSMLKRHGIVQRFQEINKNTPAYIQTIS
jgi:hypothetical protein